MHIRQSNCSLQAFLIAVVFTSLTFAEGPQSQPPRSQATKSSSASCPARTINYITHTLPQLCLTTTWTSFNTTSTEGHEISVSNEARRTPPASNSPDDLSHTAASSDVATEPGNNPGEPPTEPASTPFMSFEDWKEMMLRQTGQDPRDLRHRQANPHKANDRAPPDSAHAGLGEEDEISLNFDGYLGDLEQHVDNTLDPAADRSKLDGIEETVIFEDGRPSVHRSKDAGKTCKERFSYSSFDAGATVLKTSSGAKNAKAILVENKDSYMLLECSAKNKFVIIELSDDILIDTVVLANFEFFSSMIRHFRVSVSDRYPVKMDRWKELGLFEARNSRDIQPFLVDNPQIWAKYIRVEFLTHYGNEFYCPVSLIRIHGSRMLDSWKDSESGRDDEGHIEDHAENGEAEVVEESTHVPNEEAERNQIRAEHFSSTTSLQCTVDLNPSHLRLASSTCAAYPQPTQNPLADSNEGELMKVDDSVKEESYLSKDKASPDSQITRDAQTHSSESEYHVITPTIIPSDASATETITSNTILANTTKTSSDTPTTSSRSSSTPTTVAGMKTPSQHSSASRNRTSVTSTASAASPTIQEGFFKAIAKRLQQVETNLTLSLKYVEDHARHVQDILQKNENKQVSKIATFLDTLNQTVLSELRTVREQYDEIWQSTVIALDSQREQSGREIVALSARLNLLADEVIFQKRMAIVQAVLLLSCLLLVIFSRGVPIPSLVPHGEQPDENLFGARKPPLLRPHTLYQSEVDVDTNLDVDFDHRQDPDFVPSTRPSHELGEDTNILHSQARSGQSPASIRQYQRLSPPLTPSNLEPSTDAADAVPTYDSIPSLFRGIPNQQQTATRKPLPALPENPSSP